MDASEAPASEVPIHLTADQFRRRLEEVVAELRTKKAQFSVREFPSDFEPLWHVYEEHSLYDDLRAEWRTLSIDLEADCHALGESQVLSAEEGVAAAKQLAAEWGALDDEEEDYGRALDAAWLACRERAVAHAEQTCHEHLQWCDDTAQRIVRCRADLGDMSTDNGQLDSSVSALDAEVEKQRSAVEHNCWMAEICAQRNPELSALVDPELSALVDRVESAWQTVHLEMQVLRRQPLVPSPAATAVSKVTLSVPILTATSTTEAAAAAAAARLVSPGDSYSPEPVTPLESDADTSRAGKAGTTQWPVAAGGDGDGGLAIALHPAADDVSSSTSSSSSSTSSASTPGSAAEAELPGDGDVAGLDSASGSGSASGSSSELSVVVDNEHNVQLQIAELAEWCDATATRLSGDLASLPSHGAELEDVLEEFDRQLRQRDIPARSAVLEEINETVASLAHPSQSILVDQQRLASAWSGLERELPAFRQAVAERLEQVQQEGSDTQDANQLLNWVMRYRLAVEERYGESKHGNSLFSLRLLHARCAAEPERTEYADAEARKDALVEQLSTYRSTLAGAYADNLVSAFAALRQVMADSKVTLQRAISFRHQEHAQLEKTLVALTTLVSNCTAAAAFALRASAQRPEEIAVAVVRCHDAQRESQDFREHTVHNAHVFVSTEEVDMTEEDDDGDTSADDIRVACGNEVVLLQRLLDELETAWTRLIDFCRDQPLSRYRNTYPAAVVATAQLSSSTPPLTSVVALGGASTVGESTAPAGGAGGTSHDERVIGTATATTRTAHRQRGDGDGEEESGSESSRDERYHSSGKDDYEQPHSLVEPLVAVETQAQVFTARPLASERFSDDDDDDRTAAESLPTGLERSDIVERDGGGVDAASAGVVVSASLSRSAIATSAAGRAYVIDASSSDDDSVEMDGAGGSNGDEDAMTTMRVYTISESSGDGSRRHHLTPSPDSMIRLLDAHMQNVGTLHRWAEQQTATLQALLPLPTTLQRLERSRLELRQFETGGMAMKAADRQELIDEQLIYRDLGAIGGIGDTGSEEPLRMMAAMEQAWTWLERDVFVRKQAIHSAIQQCVIPTPPPGSPIGDTGYRKFDVVPPSPDRGRITSVVRWRRRSESTIASETEDETDSACRPPLRPFNWNRPFFEILLEVWFSHKVIVIPF